MNGMLATIQFRIDAMAAAVDDSFGWRGRHRRSPRRPGRSLPRTHMRSLGVSCVKRRGTRQPGRSGRNGCRARTRTSQTCFQPRCRCRTTYHRGWCRHRRRGRPTHQGPGRQLPTPKPLALTFGSAKTISPTSALLRRGHQNRAAVRSAGRSRYFEVRCARNHVRVVLAQSAWVMTVRRRRADNPDWLELIDRHWSINSAGQ